MSNVREMLVNIYLDAEAAGVKELEQQPMLARQHQHVLQGRGARSQQPVTESRWVSRPLAFAGKLRPRRPNSWPVGLTGSASCCPGGMMFTSNASVSSSSSYWSAVHALP
jgi:hypothetical protein